MRKLILITTTLFVSVIVGLALNAPQRGTTLVVPDPEFKTLLENLHQQEVKSLKGLKGLAVVVDAIRGDVPADFRMEDVRNDAEILLRPAQIKILTSSELGKTPGRPFLKLKVDIDAESVKNRPYTGLVKVALTQQGFLTRQIDAARKIDPKDTKYNVVLDSKNLVFVETWHTQRVFKANDFKGIREAVSTLVGAFVHDYSEAN